MADTKILALTMGDPAGIGPEVIVKSRLKARDDEIFYAIGDYHHFVRLASRIAPDLSVVSITACNEAASAFTRGLPVFDTGRSAAQIVLGKPDIANVSGIISAVEQAVAHVKQGFADGLVTAPLSKQICEQGGFRFPGHTEFLAHLDGKTQAVMMFVASGLKTVPLTVHLPLKEVFAALTIERIVTQARIVHQALKMRFGITAPRLAISGLNPHAGENGMLGLEEQEIIIPALAALADEGIDIKGPFAADSLFSAYMRPHYDVALACTHDQALIAVKTLDIARAVNVTLGLGFIRTSPDHGTAFDIADRFQASPESLCAALDLCRQLA